MPSSVAELHLIPGSTERRETRPGTLPPEAQTGSSRPEHGSSRPDHRPRPGAPEDATLEFEPEPTKPTPAAPARAGAPPPRLTPPRPPRPVAVPVASPRRGTLPAVAICGLLAGAIAMWAVLADRPAPAPEPITPPPPSDGVLDVISEPPGAVVHVDGEPHGVTPLSVSLAAGPHLVVVQHEASVEEAVVDIDAGGRVSRQVTWVEVPAPVPPPAPGGWLLVSSPVPTRVVLANQTIGTDALDRVLLPSGTHVLQFVSEAYGFRQTRTVEVRPGEATPVRISVPEAPININAEPWAEVFINGDRIGDTPLANIMRPLGDYEVVLRHPLFGERRLIARARLGEATHIAVDMRPRQE